MAKLKPDPLTTLLPANFQRPLTTVDVVIFTVLSERLHVLLIQRRNVKGEAFPNRWALPGGYVDIEKDRDLESCALRKLREKTGVASPYLEQLGSWGGKVRDPRGWSTTHAYFALISVDVVGNPVGGANAVDAQWWPISGDGVRESLAFDHKEILASAVSRLRNKVEYTSLPAFFLPKEFTLTDLQHTYEIVLGRALEKSAFRTRTLASDLVLATQRFREGANRPAQLYRLKSKTKPVFFQRTFKPSTE